MVPLAVAALGAGVFLLWSGVTDVSPIDVVRDVLAGTGTRRPLRGTITAAEAVERSTGSDRHLITAATTPALATVRGITVAASLAGPLTSLLNDAERDGVQLGGSGYRSNQRQRELYAQNCPGGKCKVPTAVPGTSMHEKGLAIDFTQGGRSLTSSSSGFRWLRSNASRYGLYNLPSEPWHWSVNGK